MTHEEIFTPQYTEASGPGSTVDYSKPYRDFLEQFIRDHHVTTLLDLGCGDMNVMGNIDLRLRTIDGNFVTSHGRFVEIDYVGIDVSKERIRRNQQLYKPPQYSFFADDFRSYPKWVEDWADLVVIKDVLQHWSTREIHAFLFRANFRRMLITNCNYGPTVNTDIETGGWRALDLTKPPFEVGEVVFHWETKDVVLIE